MFTQANHTIERQHGGLGIGLALVKRLVEMHEGEVSAGANPAGQGSEFLVKLPLMGIPKMNESSNPYAAPPSTGDLPLRILVVDDNRDSAETLSLLLELMGNEISVAYDGEQALGMANEIKPDVVLLDIGLPKMNGYEVARQIRNNRGVTIRCSSLSPVGANRRQRAFPRLGLRSPPRETCRPRSLTEAHSATQERADLIMVSRRSGYWFRMLHSRTPESLALRVCQAGKQRSLSDRQSRR